MSTLLIHTAGSSGVTSFRPLGTYVSLAGDGRMQKPNSHHAPHLDKCNSIEGDRTISSLVKFVNKKTCIIKCGILYALLKLAEEWEIP